MNKLIPFAIREFTHAAYEQIFLKYRFYMKNVLWKTCIWFGVFALFIWDICTRVATMWCSTTRLKWVQKREIIYMMYIDHTRIVMQSIQEACPNVTLTNHLPGIPDVLRRYCPILQRKHTVWCPVTLDLVGWVSAHILMLSWSNWSGFILCMPRE